MFNALVHGMGRLLAYFYELIPNYGVGIILLTVAVRVAMMPLAIKQAHVMVANRGNQEKIRKLQPEIKKIKEKYKDDRTRQYEEQKKLYDQHGINMLGGLSGCLPMLLQTPIFMAMYQVLAGCNKLFGSGRRCIPGFHVPSTSDLHAAIVSGKAAFLGLNLNLQPAVAYRVGGLGDALPYYILVALMGYTMWYQMKQMSRTQSVDPQFAQTQKVMQFMPLMLVVASLNFPAGLTVYWTASNVWTIAQQYVLMKRVGIEPDLAQEEKPPPRGLLATLMKADTSAEKGTEQPGGRQGTNRQGPGKPSSQKGDGSDPPKARKGAMGGAASRVRPGRPGKMESGSREGSAGTKGSETRKGERRTGRGADSHSAGAGSGDRNGARERRSSAGQASAAARGSSSSRPAAKSRSGGGKGRSSAKRKSKGGRK